MARWTNDELAVVLNHLDWCLTNEESFWSTIIDTLRPVSEEHLTPKQIEDRLIGFCTKQGGGITYNDLVERGTPLLNDSTLRKSITDIMDCRRPELGLGAFEGRAKEIPPAPPGSSKPIYAELKATYKGKPPSLPKEHRRTLTIDLTRRQRPPRSISPQVRIPSRSQNKRKRKRRISVSSADSLSGTSRTPAEPSTVPNPTVPLKDRAAINDLSDLQARLTALEGKLSSMSQIADTRARSVQEIERALNMAVGCLAWLLRKQTGPKSQVPDEIFTTMQVVERSFRDSPGDAFARLVQDLQQANVVRHEYQTLVRALIGQRDFEKKAEFPAEPRKGDLAKLWRSIRVPLKDAMSEDSFAVSPVQLAVAGTLSTTHLEHLVEEDLNSIIEPHDWIYRRRQHWGSPLAVQHLLAVVLCQLLFRGTETMCEVTPWAEQIYKTVADREEVRHLDRLAAQLFFQESCFQDKVLPNRVSEICECLEACAKTINGATNTNPPLQHTNIMSTGIVQKALRLKRTLMLSLHEHRVYFARPDTSFDPFWMEAEDHGGDSLDSLSCVEKKVSICLFPALVRAPTEKLPEDAEIAAALIQAKRFFPSSEEVSPSMDQDVVITKAVVLVY
ncbi:uncharacterized protein J4E79_007159 [Alternaria viburni]|uniref:uncharacterized protein n=1 Tax=Alternaria viburni TaxID=566460 RepID=UPI0020C4E8E9|nr:uncharacterized protein J4E79_007159 [Alternaria viburni]KAI4658177.1 hypothetical protein J4E79_007159 [Alternaria viburni]